MEVYDATVVETLHINPEYTITAQALRTTDTEWGLQRLMDLNLHVLFFISDRSYPRLVREFYQNLSTEVVGNDGSVSLYTHVDGYKIDLSRRNIAFALGLTLNPLGTPPPEYSFEEIARELCSHLPSGKNLIHRVHLVEHMWIVDHILQRTIFPVGDKKFKTRRALQALTAIVKGDWYDFGDCILQDFWAIKKDIQENGHRTNVMLEFPRIITRILLTSGYIILPGELSVSDFPIFGLNDWTKSHSHLKSRLAANMNQLSKGKRTVQTSPSLRAQLLRLERSLSIISQKQDHILRIQKDLAHASMQHHHQVFQLDSVIFGLAMEQPPEIMRRLVDRLELANQNYVAPHFDLNVDIQRPTVEGDDEEEGEADENDP
mgnify:FL=1